MVGEFTVFDEDDDRAFDGVAGAFEFHLTGNSFEFRDGREGVPDLLPVHSTQSWEMEAV